MADKTGQVRNLPITLQTAAGLPVSYASKAALIAAGWSVVYRLAGIVVAATWTWTVIDASRGRHEINLTLQYGKGNLYAVPPAGQVANVEAFPLDVETNNFDTLAGQINAASGAATADGGQATFTWDTEESDTFSRTVTVPLSALDPYGLTDLSWVTAASAAGRHQANRLWPTPDFTMSADIVDSANRQLALGWGGFPAGASISGGTITAVNVSTGAFTLAGDVRAQFAGTTALKVWGSTGNDGAYSLKSIALTGGATVITVNETVPSATVDGTLAQANDSRDFDIDAQLVGIKAIPITAVDQALKTFTFATALRRCFAVGVNFTVVGSTGNNGAYTPTALAYTGGNTVVTVSQSLPSAVADGNADVTIKLSPVRAVLTVSRQEDRT